METALPYNTMYKIKISRFHLLIELIQYAIQLCTHDTLCFPAIAEIAQM